MEYLGLLVVGILLSTLGIVNIRGNISTIHAWNRKRVKEADIPRYGRAIGAGTLVIGAGTLVIGAAFIISYLVTFWNAAVINYIMLPGLGIGLALILYAQLKYNHGMF